MAVKVKGKERTISQYVVRSLLLAVQVVLVFSIALIYAVFTWKSRADTINVLQLEVDSSIRALEDTRSWLTDQPEAITKLISLSDNPSEEELNRVVRILETRKGLSGSGGYALEINVVDPAGTIVASTVPSLAGLSLKSDAASMAFLRNVEEYKLFVAEEYTPSYSDDAVQVLYCGAFEENGYIIQAGITEEAYKEYIYWSLEPSLESSAIGQNGFDLMCDADGYVFSSTDGKYTGEYLSDTDFPFDFAGNDPRHLCRFEAEGVDYYVMLDWDEHGDFCAISTYPVKESLSNRNVTILTVSILVSAILATLFALLVVLLNRTVVLGVTSIAASLNRITHGDLDEKVDVRSSKEFASLSDGINSTVDALKRLIAEAAARIDKELAYAQQIQFSSLPGKFPAFPDRSEFDIYARMDTAKEVGGDFYDFYLLDGDRLAFLIADVSGKGIPAALFMMTAKTMIKNLAEENYSVNEILTIANQRLCENNEAGMFVTAWMCILNYKTGEAEFANAGHNYPVLRRKDGSFEFLKSRPGFVLAGLETVRYRKNEITFRPGDEIYLYTDGVTEATDVNDALFGDDRLLETLNTGRYEDAKGMCDMVKEDVDKFVGEAPQFDDITMVGLRYFGSPAPDEPTA